MAERPDANAILDGLKGFQRDTVEYAFDRLYTAQDSTRRFLVADEVGLGKTLVARGVIAKAIDHLWEGPDRVEQIDIVYICSNAQIATQNVQRLQIGSGRFVRAARLGLLPREIGDLRANRVNYIALTPGTSFDLRSSMGIADERAVLYHLLQRVWPDERKGPMNLLQGFVKKASDFRRRLGNLDQRSIDDALATLFKCRLLEEGTDIRQRYEDLCRRFRRTRSTIPRNDRSRQIKFIGEVRWILAQVCVKALEPDLVILDEFQRFKALMDGKGPTGELARMLFNYSSKTSAVRLLLLSATPYRMYTLHHESAQDDHYRDFLRTVEFLDPVQKDTGDLRRLLKDYRQGMYRIKSGIEPLVQAKNEIETQLRRIMSRTERLAEHAESDGMFREVQSDALHLSVEDVRDFLSLQEIGHEVRQPQVLDYWKSAPYLLSFMDDYKLKTEVVARLSNSTDDGLVKLIMGSRRISLSWEDVEAYARLDPANARMRSLIEWMDRAEAWRLLWLPPALPYYAETGKWKTARDQGLSKRLIFSKWQVVPKAISCVLGYDVERRVFRRFGDSIRNTPEERRKHTPLLRFAVAQGRRDTEDRVPGSESVERLTGMPVLGLLYPSPSLAEIGDPVPVRAGESMLGDVVSRARAELQSRLARVTEPYLNERHEDESWYWAAPILLDLEKYGESTRKWFDRWDLPRKWTREDKGEKKDSRWVAHVQEAKTLAKAGLEAAWDGSLDFGRPPKDLAETLATRSVAGPAASALRALTRTSGAKTREALCARDASAQIAWGFRKLFNRPEAMAIIRGEQVECGNVPYWRQVVDYCAAGNLQAVLDEYIHTLRDLEGLFATNDKTAWDRLAAAVTEALSLRTGAPRVDEIRADDEIVRIENHRMRNHFAMRFGAQESDDGNAAVREGHVRRAFNSPFWPFVLGSTSVGQEGLDFHAYCHAVMHWNLPSNPVDLEQREGRVHRYKGHAVRKNIAKTYGAEVLGAGGRDVWHDLFEVAQEQASSGRGLVPYWLFPLPEGAHIERHVPALPLSRDASHLAALRGSLAVYRMVFGQPRQDDLVTFILEWLGSEELEEIVPLLRIDLSARQYNGPMNSSKG